MAARSSSSLAGAFGPEKYHDEYREQVLELIDQKAAGQEIVAQPEPEAPAKVLDLMAALEASLKRAGRDDEGAAADDDEDEDDDVAASPSRSKARPRKAATAAKSSAKKAKPAAGKKAPPKKRSA
jgi:DNA end-binding protein Ku